MRGAGIMIIQDAIWQCDICGLKFDPMDRTRRWTMVTPDPGKSDSRDFHICSNDCAEHFDFINGKPKDGP